MRTRFAVLAALICGLSALLAPVVAGAAPHHNKGLTIAATPNPIVAGDGVLIYGQLNGSDNSDQTISLYHRIAPARTFTLVGTTTTSAAGFYEFPRADGVVVTNRDWFVRGPDGTHSRTVHERVSALVTLSQTSTTGITRHKLQFAGSVSPNHPDQRVLLQEQDSSAGNGWHTIARTFTGPASGFTVSHAWRTPGDYTLRAYFPADPRNIAGESDTITESIQQAENPAFTINSSSPIIAEGKSATISGVLDAAGTTTPQPATQVTLYGKQATGGFEALATTITRSDGSYGFTVTPVHNTLYYVAETLAPKRRSADLFEGVQDTLTINASSTTATEGGTVNVNGTVSPDKTGHAISLQRLGPDGHWHNVESGTVTAGSRYAFTYTFGQAGTIELRARITGGPENVGNASTPVTVIVSGVAPASSLPPAS